MINSISYESKKSINVLILIWFAMLFAQFIYLFVCYFMLTEGIYESSYTPIILKETIVFMNINLYSILYIVASLILLGGYFYFKISYSKLVVDAQEQNFKDIEEEFKYFQKKYTSIMFIYLAIFQIISIIGIIVFLLTLDISTMINMTIISSIGYILIMPSKSKFNYRLV